MRKRRLLPIAPLLVFAAAGPAAADQRAAPQPPEALTRVVQCRAIADSAERLACFDREVAAMEQAQTSGQLVAIDRQQVRRTRRSLFGLRLPDLGIFGDDNGDDEAEESRIESRIRSAQQNGLGRWIIELEDGARWIQVDNVTLALRPRAGQTIQIRRAALGSYLARVNDQSAIRMRRMR